jgi:hypothetical protein
LNPGDDLVVPVHRNDFVRPCRSGDIKLVGHGSHQPDKKTVGLQKPGRDWTAAGLLVAGAGKSRFRFGRFWLAQEPAVSSAKATPQERGSSGRAGNFLRRNFVGERHRDDGRRRRRRRTTNRENPNPDGDEG